MTGRNLLLVWSLVVASPAFAALTTQDLNTLTPDQLASILAGPGVTVSNVQYTGAPLSAGTFAGGADAGSGTANIGIASGVILSSGNIASVVGPNTSGSISTSTGFSGDPDLSAIAGGDTLDAAVLEFDFVPSGDKVFFQYIFASEEYNEFVNSTFNDVFGFFINGVNCGTVGNPLVPVSVNTINNGNPFGSGGPNAVLYQNNEIAAINTEMDGLTVVLTCEAVVIPNAANHAKLAIADTADDRLDSNVFLSGGSITTIRPVEAAPATPQVPVLCRRSGCRLPITCKFAQSSGGSCNNSIKVFVRRNVARSSDASLLKAPPRSILFATGVANVPPGQTAPVTLKLKPRGKKIVKAKKGKRIKAVMEIQNVAGTTVEATDIRLKLK